MALFGHDTDVRRVSSNISVMVATGEDGSLVETKDGKCTAGKIKSCMKIFFANLFSHVGLGALVIGYSIMGAFIFGYLEQDNELNTRQLVGNTRKETLDELYSITGRRKAIFFCFTPAISRKNRRTVQFGEKKRPKQT